ncbi:dihydroxyacetone kinase subunit DhaL [Alicyclobacillus kakegawensis]|uniref:dihydroxyacetone kinase subunit DhaL n=1 Tax=Alicyclobacillus kakegawensis TaxID=392012 RepID=UPI00083338FD|nr:dihydroxyacetone kinase subunit DhaL [Alicyclobacillus kakegawensis]
MANVTSLSSLFRRVSEEVQRNREALCQLDGAVGDGDHGVSMDIGWAAVRDVPVDETMDCGTYLINCSKRFIQAVGASIGPLYGTAFLRAGKYVMGKHELSSDDCLEMFRLAVEGMQERGKAKIGDKTLMDTLLPCLETLSQSVASRPLPESLTRALEAARAGMESTKDLVAKVGRSKFLGERSAGVVDPGAASAYLVLKAMYDFILKHIETPGMSSNKPSNVNENCVCEGVRTS